MCREAKNLSHLIYLLPAEVKQGDALPFCVSSETVNKCPFHDLFSATLPHLCAFHW